MCEREREGGGGGVLASSRPMLSRILALWKRGMGLEELMASARLRDCRALARSSCWNCAYEGGGTTLVSTAPTIEVTHT